MHGGSGIELDVAPSSDGIHPIQWTFAYLIAQTARAQGRFGMRLLLTARPSSMGAGHPVLSRLIEGITRGLNASDGVPRRKNQP